MATSIFELVGSVMVDTDKANKSLSETDQKAGGLGQTLAAGAKGAIALGAGVLTAVGATTTAVFGMAKESAGHLDEIQKGAQKMQLSYGTYQELSYICERNGTSIDKMDKGIKNMTDTIADAKAGNEKAAKSYDAIGVSLKDAEGNYKATEDVLKETLITLAGMEDEQARNAAAADIFGKSYGDLLPLLNGGAEGIEELTAKSHELGLVLDDETIDSGAAFQDMMDDVNDSLGSVVTQIGAQLMPVVADILSWVLDHMPEIQAVIGTVFDFLGQVITVAMDWIGQLKSWVDEHSEQIRTVVETVVNAIKDFWEQILQPAFQAIGDFIRDVLAPAFKDVFENSIKPLVTETFNHLKEIWENTLKPAFEQIKGFIQDTLAPAFEHVFKDLIQPIVKEVFEGIGIYWNEILLPIFQGIIEFVTNVFNGDWDKAWHTVTETFGKVWEGIKDLAKGPINGVIDIINNFLDSLGEIEIPDWVPIIGGETFAIPHIPRLATGGDIVGDGLAMVGEAGPEVIELPTGARVTPLGGENFDRKMDRLIGLLETYLPMAGQNEIILDGRIVGQVINEELGAML